MPIAVSQSYVALEELKATLSLQGETFADDDVARALNAASRLIDAYCGQRFYQDTSDATRTFTADDASNVTLRPGLSMPPTSVKTDANGDGTYETTWTSTDYTLLPLNAAADGLPFTSLERKTTAANTFPTRTAGVQTVGRFGWPTTPPGVIEACRIQAARFIKRTREAPLGVAGVGFEGGAMRLQARLDVDVEVLLGPLTIRQMVF